MPTHELSTRILNAIAGGLEDNGGRFILSFDTDNDQWVCGIEYGQEAPGSDMAAAAAYGMADKHASPATAVEEALDQTGWLEKYNKDIK